MRDIEAVVEKLAELELLRPTRIIGNWYQCYCPFHNNGNEKRPSFGILLHEEVKNGQVYPAGFGHCFTCSWAGSLVELVTELLKRRSITQSTSDWFEANLPGFLDEGTFEYLIPQSMMSQLSNTYALNYIQTQQGHTESFIPEEELASYRYTVPYMYERKLTDDIIARYDIGVDVNWIPPGRKQKVPCITFPVRDKQGRTLFVARRSIQGKLFNYPQGVSKPVYGIDQIPPGTKSVVICESMFNALTGVAYGYPSVALLGTGNAYQIQQLKELGVHEFVLAMDGDEAGRRAAEKLKRALRGVAIVWTIEMPDGKDLNDLDKATFDKLYEERV